MLRRQRACATPGYPAGFIPINPPPREEKVYYDLLEQRRKNEQKDVAIVRIELAVSVPASGRAGRAGAILTRA